MRGSFNASWIRRNSSERYAGESIGRFRGGLPSAKDDRTPRGPDAWLPPPDLRSEEGGCGFFGSRSPGPIFQESGHGGRDMLAEVLWDGTLEGETIELKDDEEE